MAQLTDILKNLKFSAKEMAVFLAMVKLGRATAAEVAREARVTRTHVYDIAAELVQKGLVSEVEERKIKKYEATDHAGLVAYVSRQQKELAQTEIELQKAASEFKALQTGEQQKTNVRFFDGVEGVKQIYAEVRQDFSRQSEKFELLTVFSPENLERVMPKFQYFSYPNALGRDIIAEDSMLPAVVEQLGGANEQVTFRVWPKSRGLFPTDTIAWKNKLAFIDVAGNPSGIIIENASMYVSFVMWFNSMWESLGRKG